MRLIRPGGVMIAMASSLVVACNLLTGVDTLEIGDGDDASVPTIGTDSGPSDSTTFADVRAPVDTGPPPTCPSAGHSCAKAPPAGWDGPFLLYVGAEADAPACPTEMPEQVDAPTGDVTGDFTCECKCGLVTGAKCTAFLDEFNGSGCPDPQVGREDLAGCRTPGGENSFRASIDLTDPGTCPASAAFKTKADAAFAGMTRRCQRATAFTSDGCAGDELCVPDGVAPFGVRSCIGNADPSAACPAPWTASHRIYDSVTDTRACNTGSCSCDGPTGITCTAKMKNFIASTTCQGPGPQLDLPVATCTAAGAGTSQKLVGAPTAVGGSCNATGRPWTAGGVAGAGGRILCCVP